MPPPGTWGEGAEPPRPVLGGTGRKGPSAVSASWLGGEAWEDGRKGSATRGLGQPLRRRASRGRRGWLRGTGACGCAHEAPRALQLSGGILRARAWCKTKASLSLAFQMATLALAFRTGLPWQMPRKPAWWPPGQLESERAGEGSRARITSRSGLLPLRTAHVAEYGLLRPPVHEGPTEQTHCIFSPGQSWPRQLEA